MEARIIGDSALESLCAGFERGGFPNDGRRIVPLCARAAAADGRYRLSVKIHAQQDADEVLLFANHRRLLWRGVLRAGESVCVDTACMVHPYLPDNADEPVKSGGIELALIGEGTSFESIRVEAADVPAVLLLGDSTVTDQRAASPYAPGATYCGWGQMMPAFLGEQACVGNFARSGLTVETIRTEGLYDLMKAQLRPGDLVLIQFGHNDQKRPHLTADGGFAQGLKCFVHELRALGARPVLVTPLARNSWKDEQEYFDLLKAFALAAKQLGKQEDVPVIDLHAFMRDMLIATGRDAAKALFHIGDYTHTNDFGAGLAAGFVAEELSRRGLVKAKMADAWKPHGPYNVPASDQGDESLPPTGLEALYRSYETVRPDAPLTRQEALELVCRTCSLFAHNAPAALPADVPQDEPYSADVRCAVQHGLIPQDMLADGKFHRCRAISGEEFTRILTLGYRMRCPADDLPKAHGETISRRRAAALCREAKV